MGVLEKVRRWIDGETAELVLEEAARNAQVKPRSEAEEFVVTIAREIEAIIQREMLPLPQGTTIIPTEYNVFLSEADDKEWHGIKRRGLEQGLYHILAERAREIAGKKKLETRSFVIQLRVDGTLEKGKVRVMHSWEDSESSKTGVLKRPQALNTNPSLGQMPARPSAPPQQPPAPAYVPPKPVGAPPPSPAKMPPIVRSEEGEVMTSVRPRATELYKLEIWRGGVRQSVLPIFSPEVTVGRGSRSRPVDVALPGDVEISRQHLKIATDGQGKYWAVNLGKNPASIGGFELPEGQRVPLTPGTNLVVCSYVLRVQPKD
ncbi:MAG: FHA domain-containing protein [Acidobacteria bacterium]|nr:FHA domain-containing protein [Acidobacteriota bacterium]